MNPNEEQKKAARRMISTKQVIFDSFHREEPKIDGNEEMENLIEWLAETFASREQQAAENVARVVLEAVERVDVQSLFTPEGAQQKCEEAARSAASPFLNRKGE